MQQEDQWEVALDDGEIKRMTVGQLDDAFRLGIVRETTMVRQVGKPQWQPLSVAAGLDEDPLDPAQESTAGDEDEEPSTQVHPGATRPAPPPLPSSPPSSGPRRPRNLSPASPIAVPRPAPPTPIPSKPAYAERLPPPVSVTGPEVPEKSRPVIPVATVTRSSAAPPPLPPNAFGPERNNPPASVPPVAAGPTGTVPMHAFAAGAPDAQKSVGDEAGPAVNAQAALQAPPLPAEFASSPPPLPADFPASPTVPLPSAALAPSSVSAPPPLPAGAFAPEPQTVAPVFSSFETPPLELTQPDARLGVAGSLILGVAIVAGVTITLQRHGTLESVLGAKLEQSVFGAPGVYTPRGVRLLVETQPPSN